MPPKNKLLEDLILQRAEAVELLKGELSKEDREAVVKKINSLDVRIKRQEELATSEVSEWQKAINSLTAKVDTIAKEGDIIKDKLHERNITIKGVNESYLESANAMKDFANAMRTAVEHGGNFAEGWCSALHKNGITIESGSESAYLPTPVKGVIADKWKQYGSVLMEFNNTGAKAYYARYTEQEQDSTDVRAKGFASGAGNTKTEQSLTLAAKLLQSDYVYKMISVSNKSIWDDDTKLIDYVMDELFKQWNYEVLRAILIGDGRLASSDDKITTIEAIARTTSDTFVTVVDDEQTSGQSTMEFLMDNAVLPLYDGTDDILLFVGKADANALRKRLGASGATPEYKAIQDVAAEMGVRQIVVVPYLDAVTYEGPRAIAVHSQKYDIVGSLSPVFSSFEDFKKNDTVFRVEIPIGGGTAAPETAVFVVNPEEPEP